MKYLSLITITIFCLNSFAMDNNLRTNLILRLLENNNRKAEQIEKQQREIPRTLRANVIFSQSDEDGESVAIFETKECGKLGYTPKDLKKAKQIENSKMATLTVKNCEIIDVRPN